MATARQKIVVDYGEPAGTTGPLTPGTETQIETSTTITTTWGLFATALGNTAPLNLQRARTAVRAIPGAGR